MELYYKQSKLGGILSVFPISSNKINIKFDDSDFQKCITNDEDRLRNDIVPYNIGNLLSIPNLKKSINWNCSEMSKRHHLWPNTIVGFFFEDYIESRDDPLPNFPKIKIAVKRYILENNLMSSFNEFDLKDTLVIHVRVGDWGIITNSYLNAIKKCIQSNKFEHYLILLGAHSNWNHLYANLCHGDPTKETVFKNFEITIKLLLALSPNIKFFISSADTHISFMSICHNLLIHRGTFTCLGGMMCDKNVFVTKEFEYNLGKKVTRI